MNCDAGFLDHRCHLCFGWILHVRTAANTKCTRVVGGYFHLFKPILNLGAGTVGADLVHGTPELQLPDCEATVAVSHQSGIVWQDRAARDDASRGGRWLDLLRRTGISQGYERLVDSKSCEWGLLPRRETGRSTSRSAFLCTGGWVSALPTSL